ncbi:MAG: Fe-S cluster assembly protein SufD [Alphaproteobacteria bacterium]|nr:Fe-S cluster assembly protein SufD [Alphaproteobacteria bacterium]
MPLDLSKSPPFDELIAGAKSRAGEAGDNWLVDLNARARTRFATAGWPHARSEPWKYTNLNALAAAEFSLASTNDGVVPEDRVLASDAPRVVLVNGVLNPSLSNLDQLPKGASLTRLADAGEADRAGLMALLAEESSTDGLPLAALNAATLSDALILDFADGSAPETPVHLISIGASENAAFAPRVVIRAGKDCYADVIESHVGAGAEVYFSNIVTQVTVAEGARLGHYRVQNEAAGAFHIALTVAEVAEGAVYDNFVLSLGARLARNEIRGEITGARVEYRINGAYMAAGSQHHDNTTFIDHAAAGSRSREVYKGVLAGSSRGVFQGKILVRRDAQQTDGYQMNRGMLMSDRAEIDSKPELEIYADDVRCSHGATVGELEEEHLFYLQARGVDRETARRLLVAAYIDDAINEIQSEPMRDAMQTLASVWLENNLTGDGA